MSLVKYIGPLPAVTVPSAGGARAEKGSSIPVSEDVAAALLMDPTDWEAGDEETLALVPHFPQPITMVTGFAGAFDPTTVYPSGVLTTEGGMLYHSKTASVGETPSQALHVWDCLGPIAPSGVPGLLVPIAALGSPIGVNSLTYTPLLATFARGIVPKTGKVSECAVYGTLLEGSGAVGIRMALYDTGQTTPGTYTLLGQSAVAHQNEAEPTTSVFTLGGDLGAPEVVAGQHVMMGLALDAAGLALTAVFPGLYIPLPTGFLPGNVEGKLLGSHTLSSLVFPGTIAEADMNPEVGSIGHFMVSID